MSDSSIEQYRYTPIAVWCDERTGDVMLKQSGHYVWVDNTAALLRVLQQSLNKQTGTAA